MLQYSLLTKIPSLTKGEKKDVDSKLIYKCVAQRYHNKTPVQPVQKLRKNTLRKFPKKVLMLKLSETCEIPQLIHILFKRANTWYLKIYQVQLCFNR